MSSDRQPHHLLVTEGPAPDVLVVALPPGSARGPAGELLYTAGHLAARGIRTWAFDLNLACHAAAPATVQGRWHEYADAQYNVPETAAAIFRAWGGLAQRAADEIVALAPGRLAIHVTPAALRIAADLTSRLREAGFPSPVLWFGPAVRPGLETLLPAGSFPAAFLPGDPEQALANAVEGGVASARAGVAVPGGGRFIPITPFQSLDSIGLPDLGGVAFGGYSGLQVPVLMQRGCVERCPHCPRGPHGLLLRSRPVEQVVAEMERLHREKGVTDFFLGDTMAASRPGDLQALARRIREIGLPLTWEARYLASAQEADDHYRRLYEGGCRRLRFCLPSGPAGYRLEPHLGRALRLSWRAAIRTSLDTLVVGLPVVEGGTSPDDSFDQLIRFLWESADFVDDIETVSDVLLLHGTAYDREPARFGLDRVGRDPWRDWHDNGFLNREFRRKRLKELHVFLESKRVRLPSRERVFGMGGPLLEQEPAVRKRMEARVARPLDAVLATAPGGRCDVPPYALARMASALRERGLLAAVHDFNLDLHLRSPAEARTLWGDAGEPYWSHPATFDALRATFGAHFERWAGCLAGTPAAVIVLHVNESNRLSTLELLFRTKIAKPALRIFLAGEAIASEEGRALFARMSGGLIDGYLATDPELVLPDVVAAVRAGGRASHVPGVVTCPDALEARECWRAPARTLDLVPFGDFREVDLTLYPARRLVVEWGRRRGGEGGRPRTRTAESIVEELTFHAARHGFREFEVEAPAFEGDLEWLTGVADAVARAGLTASIAGRVPPRANGALARLCARIESEPLTPAQLFATICSGLDSGPADAGCPEPARSEDDGATLSAGSA